VPARALIVDDSSLARAVIGDALTSHGIEVIGEAGDGISALEAYQRLQPDLVTMDLTMPGVDGLTALRSIIEVDPRARVVVISVAGQEDVVVHALQSGAIGFLLKPFEPHQLIDLLRRTGAIEGGSGEDRRRLYVVEAQRRIEALGEDVRDLSQSPGDRTLLESVRRHAQVLAGMANRVQDRPTSSLAVTVERLAAAARGMSGPALSRGPVLLHEAMVGLNKLLLACARGEDDSMFADALRAKIDAAIEAAKARPVEPGSGPRALVLEAEPFTRRVLEGFLKREGFDVVAVNSIEEAVEEVAAIAPMLVIVESDSARVDGHTAIRRIRGAPGGANAAILLLTPRSELSEKLAAFQAGADDVVVTPFEPEEVVARVQAMVARLRRGGTSLASTAG
jgi:two-component system chemotaxis response regulator CheY